jgi:23S rRNA pseudoU1915 N3-methylase RlmH
MQCNICKTHTEDKLFSKHIRKEHKLTNQEYYDLYLATASNNKICPVCSSLKTRFKNLVEGYTKTCSYTCSYNSEEISKIRSNSKLGSKQSEETIAKRIANTDQTKKEKTRIKTMLEKYGTSSTVCVMDAESKQIRSEKISKKLKGRNKSVETIKKHVESRRKNNSYGHTEQTKNTISEKIRSLHQSDNPPVTVSEINQPGRGHKFGTFDGIFYRSSYELKFLEQCKQYGIIVQSAANIDFRIQYMGDDGKLHMYYPDFYLPEYDTLIEIKPENLLFSETNQIKFDAAALQSDVSNYMVLTEEDLFFEHDLWVKKLEYILP